MNELMAALGLYCCARAFFSCRGRAPLFVAVHTLGHAGFSSRDADVQLACDTRALPGPGIEPCPLSRQAGFFTTWPAEKSSALPATPSGKPAWACGLGAIPRCLLCCLLAAILAILSRSLLEGTGSLPTFYSLKTQTRRHVTLSMSNARLLPCRSPRLPRCFPGLRINWKVPEELCFLGVFLRLQVQLLNSITDPGWIPWTNGHPPTKRQDGAGRPGE